MRINYIENNSDHSGPIIELMPESESDAFDLGMLFQRLLNQDACVWKNGTTLRLPLVMMDEIGLAITHKKKAV